MDKYRRADGYFEFCLMYPGTGLEPIYWAQSSNPLLNDSDEVEN